MNIKNVQGGVSSLSRNSLLNKIVLLSVTAALVVGGFFVGTGITLAATLAPAPAPCATVGTPFITFSRNISNNPDSGNFGNWATDAYTETVNVWVGDSSTYCANANVTNATFVTTGPLSPEVRNPLVSGISGTFTGGENYTLPSSLTIDPLYSNTSVLHTPTIPDSATEGFSSWVHYIFPSVSLTTGSSYVNTYWLTYVTPRNGTWTDADSASGGNVGNIGSIIDITTGLTYPTIQAAIGAAKSDDIINVAAGDYTENLTIDRSLTIIGVGVDTVITGSIKSTGNSVTIQNLKVTNINEDSKDDSTDPLHTDYDYGVWTRAGQSLTLTGVTVDVSHNAILMTDDSATNTALTINNSTIKGYGALVISGAINSAGDTTSAVVTINNTNLTGSTSSSGSFDDFSVIGMSGTKNVTVNFTGTSSVVNKYTDDAQSKERLIAFYSANNNSVTGTPTYTNAVNSKVNANTLFVSAYGSAANTVEDQVVARYVTKTEEFENALTSDATTPIVVGRYETTWDTTPVPIETTKDNTLKTGVTLIIEDHNTVKIGGAYTLVNNGTIIIESYSTLTPGVAILDQVAPVITLLGSATVNLTIGDSYTDAGATALDNQDGNITDHIVTVNPVNTATAGTYTVTYNVSDTAHNAATPVTRTVNVVAAPRHGSSGGSYTTPAVPANVAIPDGCAAGDKFSTTTGRNCNAATPAVPAGQVLGASTQVGQVLGAEKFNFTKFLKFKAGSYKFSLQGTEVMELQKLLTTLGYDLGIADGKFGAKTKGAVIKFQIANGLKGDGIIGALTRAVLNK